MFKYPKFFKDVFILFYNILEIKWYEKLYRLFECFKRLESFAIMREKRGTFEILKSCSNPIIKL